MPKRSPKPAPEKVMPRFRIFCGDDIALGPGKVELLKWLRETGSIRDAAARMEMSYMRAWGLIRTMNQCFKSPLVAAARGGSERGGARLTRAGICALELYDRLEAESQAATQKTRRQLAAMMKKSAK